MQRAGDARALERLLRFAYSSRIAISAGISDSAMAISLRPQSASDEVGDAEIGELRIGCFHRVYGLQKRQSARTVSDASAVEFS